MMKTVTEQKTFEQECVNYLSDAMIPNFISTISHRLKMFSFEFAEA